MKYLQTGYRVHASNLARSGVPGAVGQELLPFSLQTTPSSPPQTSIPPHHAKHIGLKGTLAQNNFRSRGAPVHEVSLSGNTISDKEELRKLNQIATEHQRTTTLYSAFTAINKTVNEL